MQPQMSANQVASHKLAFEQLKDKLKNVAQTLSGQNLARSIEPNLNIERIQEIWDIVEPLYTLASQNHFVCLPELSDLNETLKLAKLGSILDIEHWANLLLCLEGTEQAIQFAKKWHSESKYLNSLATNLDPLTDLKANFFRCIDYDGSIKDSASTKLKTARYQLRQTTGNLQSLASQLQNNPNWKKYLVSTGITERHGRIVLPVRIDGRGRVKGRVIEISSTGTTLYIEPESFYPINEKRIELENDEKIETYRIYKELAEQVSTHAKTLKNNFSTCVDLDLHTARARLAVELNCSRIELSQKGAQGLKIKLHQARHPLLVPPRNSPVIANNIELEDQHAGLIISGPNAGGKTAILKTVGLFQLMAKAGLLLPCSANSHMTIAENIFVEMGDTQDLQANLSTFSGHLQGLKKILSHSQAGDLILLDEICVGTQPAMGQALGEAIIEDLVNRKACVFVTTHYDGIKELANRHPHIRNASMQFDTQNIRSTYKLQLDIPGQSFGLELAKQTSLPNHIIEKTKKIVGRQETDLEATVKKLSASHAAYEQKNQELQKSLQQAEKEKSRWQHEIKLNQQHRERAIQSIKLQYEKLLCSIRDEWEQDKKQRRAERNKTSVVGFAPFAENTDHAHYEKKIKSSLNDLKGQLSKTETNQNTSFETGDFVQIPMLRQSGKIVQIKNSKNLKKYVIQTETAKITLNGSQLKATSKFKTTQQKNKPAKNKVLESPSNESIFPMLPSNQIDLRGKTADEALTQMWLFLDRAFSAGESYIWIIHGHGTHKLKQVLREAIQHCKHYSLNWKSGKIDQGGDGVTLVQFL